MKKHRGLKRYYKNLEVTNEFNKKIVIDFKKPETWSGISHVHFDLKGYGNDSFKRRKPHLDKFFRHFDILVDKTENLKIDFQLYTILLDFDSSSDALFFHTPSPKNSLFPFKINEFKLTTTLANNQLNEYINNLDDYEKLFGKAGEAFCLLFKKNVGQSFLNNVDK